MKRMYLFKHDALRNKVIDVKQINQWKQILHESEESL